MAKKAYTSGEIAEFCQVTHRTVLDWAAQGKLKAYQTPGKHLRVLKEDLIKFFNKFKIPIPKELKEETVSRKRILIVDDDRDMVSSVDRILRAEDCFEIEKAYDGFTAGLRFNEFKPDLVLLDIRMPGISGYDVCFSIRKNSVHADVRIIIISGLTEDNIQTRAKEVGADDFLAKPFGQQELVSVIQKHSPVEPIKRSPMN